MKRIITLATSLVLICLCTNGFADDLRKKIVGKWYNPYTYESTGEKKGFHFKKNGVCKALNIKTLDLKEWHIKDGKLMVKGLYLDEKTGKWEEYKTAEYIEQVNSDTLYVLTARKPYKIGFLYLSPKALKEKVTPFSGQFDER